MLLTVFFFKIFDENFPTPLPNNWRHDLACRWNGIRLFWSPFYLFSPLFWLLFCLGCELMDEYCFVVAKNSIETTSRHCFCLTVNKRGTLFAHSFLTYKFSENMQCIAFFEMPSMSASSHTFSRRSCSTAWWNFITLSGVITPLYHWNAHFCTSYGFDWTLQPNIILLSTKESTHRD